MLTFLSRYHSTSYSISIEMIPKKAISIISVNLKEDTSVISMNPKEHASVTSEREREGTSIGHKCR